MDLVVASDELHKCGHGASERASCICTPQSREQPDLTWGRLARTLGITRAGLSRAGTAALPRRQLGFEPPDGLRPAARS